MKRGTPAPRNGDDTIFVGDEARPAPSLLRRIFRLLREVLVWALALVPGLLIVAYGAGGIRNERLVGVGRYKLPSYGENAVGWGWIFVALGFWTLGQCCYLKAGHAVFKLFGWILTAGALGVGFWILCRRFV